jgi:hypothetical protein
MFSMFQNIQTLHITSVISYCFPFLGKKTVGKNSFKPNRNGMILTTNMQSRSTREGKTQGKSLITLYNDAGMSLQMRRSRLQEIFIRICARRMGIALFFRFVYRLLLLQEMAVAGRKEIMILVLLSYNYQ